MRILRSDRQCCRLILQSEAGSSWEFSCHCRRQCWAAGWPWWRWSCGSAPLACLPQHKCRLSGPRPRCLVLSRLLDLYKELPPSSPPTLWREKRTQNISIILRGQSVHSNHQHPEATAVTLTCTQPRRLRVSSSLCRSSFHRTACISCRFSQWSLPHSPSGLPAYHPASRSPLQHLKVTFKEPNKQWEACFSRNNSCYGWKNEISLKKQKLTKSFWNISRASTSPILCEREDEKPHSVTNVTVPVYSLDQ